MPGVKQINRLKEDWAEFANTLNEDRVRVPAFTIYDNDMVLSEDTTFDSSVAVNGSLIGARRQTEAERASVSAEGVVLIKNEFRAGCVNASDVVIGGNAVVKDINAVNTVYGEADVLAKGKIVTYNGGYKSKGKTSAGILYAHASEPNKYAEEAPIIVEGPELNVKLKIYASHGNIEVPNGNIISPFVSTTRRLYAGTVVTKELRASRGILAYRVEAEVAYVLSDSRRDIRIERNEIKKTILL